MKPTLKAPGDKLLKPTSKNLLSSFAFSLNVRRYTTETRRDLARRCRLKRVETSVEGA